MADFDRHGGFDGHDDHFPRACFSAVEADDHIGMENCLAAACTPAQEKLVRRGSFLAAGEPA